MIDHTGVTVSNVTKSKMFYRAALAPLGYELLMEFEQFAGFAQDAVDNKAFLAKGKLKMPVLAVGADKSFGTAMADDLHFVAENVTGGVVPNSGHWLMEEQPAATIATIRAFIDAKN